MPRYRVLVQVLGSQERAAACRTWIDACASSLRGEVELDLEYEEQVWQASFDVATTARTVFYRVGLIAAIGAS
jgi:hypothetical protein